MMNDENSLGLRFDPVYALLDYLSPNQTRKCFAARPSGLFVSSDRAANWQNAYQSLLGDLSMPTVALAKGHTPGSAGVLFAGVPGAVLRSNDGGLNWQVARLPEPEPIVTALAVSSNFAEDGTAFAATEEDGVFVSQNQGDSWVSWNFGLLDVHAFSLAVSPNLASDHQVFVGVSTGIFTSTNRGRSWTPVDLPCGYDAVLSLVLSPKFSRDGIGFAGTEENGLLRTTDGGRSWQMVGNQEMRGSVNQIVLDISYPEKPYLAALVNSGLFISRDDGEQWESWKPKELPERFELTAFSAPDGLEESSQLWFGGRLGEVFLL